MQVHCCYKLQLSFLPGLGKRLILFPFYQEILELLCVELTQNPKQVDQVGCFFGWGFTRTPLLTVWIPIFCLPLFGAKGCLDTEKNVVSNQEL